MYEMHRPGKFVEDDLWELCLSVDPCAVSDVLNKRGVRQRTMDAGLQGIAPGLRTVGVVRTMSSRPLEQAPDPSKEYGLLFEAIDQLSPGEVLLTDTLGCCVWGELCTERARRRGGNGVVIDGYYRDSDRVLASGYPVFARGRHMSDMLYHREIVALNQPVLCAGVYCAPGDLVLGASDGVVVVPAKMIDSVVREAATKASAEDKVRAALATGASAADTYRSYGVF
ncbi:RraA family protein [Candidimonas nitroreducens]|uniref:Putative 4-hydroxy-4-methyl-2-oxoglutarate aldolase n=1 Tax=Candidimonas nitroreducens TaxID=683354 RepID=A0A225M620_9BURK|nr:hypothetical protein [Candidimonas nitroreducens]OWT56767.1 hypothetical protein CEY11_17875 [Candidimonas nitroreducens]